MITARPAGVPGATQFRRPLPASQVILLAAQDTVDLPAHPQGCLQRANQAKGDSGAEGRPLLSIFAGCPDRLAGG